MITNTDWFMYFAWAFLFCFNRQAFLMIACLFSYHIFYLAFPQNKESFLMTAMLFAALSIAHIRIMSDIRKAFLLFAGLYWLSAVDEFAYYTLGFETGLRFVRPYVVVIINAYIATTLWINRRPDNGHFNNNNSNSFFFFDNLFLCKAIQKKQKEFKRT